jgi:hypothetical protein
VNILRYKIFAAAIAVSAALHIFWILAIRVVAAPAASPPVKFSRVYFLGPILGPVPVEVRMEPRQLSAAEKRYFITIDKRICLPTPPKATSAVMKETPRADFYIMKDWKLLDLIREALDEPKEEPRL